MFVGAAGPVRAANSVEGGSLGVAHKGLVHGRIHLWRNPLEGMRRVGASEGHSYGVSMQDGRCQHCVECLDHHCSGERERLKGTAARANGLVIKFERADAVEDIMTEVRGPRIGLMVRHECAMPRAESASTRVESVFVDKELFTVLAALVCLHLVKLNL